MIEPQFSELFNKMLKQLNKNIKNINGVDCYAIPTKTINDLKKLFFAEPDIVEEDNAETDSKIDTMYDVEFYKPFF